LEGYGILLDILE